ncbi:MAG TPA: hypothetical protein VHI52_09640, partial [Verrucomicrobiae bacterium]|nr:hypothetical protein [Verrucomicrobiae bacterium]
MNSTIYSAPAEALCRLAAAWRSHARVACAARFLAAVILFLPLAFALAQDPPANPAPTNVPAAEAKGGSASDTNAPAGGADKNAA